MNDEQFRDILQHFIIAYDEKSGPYPEHEYEGVSFYSFVCDTLGIEDNSLKIIKNNPYVYDYKLNGIRDE
jgi:hypothetical protein